MIYFSIPRRKQVQVYVGLDRVALLDRVLLSDLSDWFLWFPNMSRCCIPRLPRHTKAGNEKGIHELTTRCLSLAKSFVAALPKFGFQPSTSLTPLKFSTLGHNLVVVLIKLNTENKRVFEDRWVYWAASFSCNCRIVRWQALLLLIKFRHTPTYIVETCWNQLDSFGSGKA